MRGRMRVLVAAVSLGVLAIALGAMVVTEPDETYATRLSARRSEAIRGWAPDSCKFCKTGWHSIQEFAGVMECEHGPERNDTCKKIKADSGLTWEQFWPKARTYCWERNGHKGGCKCFECGKAPGCEYDFQVNRAWCGQENKTNCAPCPTTTGPVSDLVQQRGATMPATKVCGGTRTYHVVYDCGRVQAAVLACDPAPDCVGVGNWVTIMKGRVTLCKTTYQP